MSTMSHHPDDCNVLLQFRFGVHVYMRVSLYIPDALWLRAREPYRISGNSRLVQTALECLVADARPKYLEGPPPACAGRLQRLQERLTVEARAAYEAGYEVGLDAAEVFDWWALDQLACADWRLDQLLGSWAASGVVDDLRRLLADRRQPGCAGFLAELERGKAGDLRRVATFAGGLVAALRDCFEGASAVAVPDDTSER
jgi:hypothetical protein